MKNDDLVKLIRSLVDFDAMVSSIVAAVKEDMRKEEELESDKVADKISSELAEVFEDKETINEFVDKQIKGAQELVKQSEETGEAIEVSRQKPTEPRSLVGAVEIFFSLVNSTEDAGKFTESLQQVMTRHKRGKFGLGTTAGIAYGEFELGNKTVSLKSEDGQVHVQYVLTEDDVTNEELRCQLFYPADYGINEEEEGQRLDSWVNDTKESSFSDILGDEEETSFDPQDIVEGIEYAEEVFYHEVEVILDDIIRLYSHKMPAVDTLNEADESVMRFFLTHATTLFSPAVIHSLSREELLHEFQRRVEPIVHP